MIPVYIAIAIAAISLPISGKGLAAFAEQNTVHELDLPELERLKIVVPPPQKEFDAAPPNLIEQPTPVLKLVIPAPREVELFRRAPSAAPPTEIH